MIKGAHTNKNELFGYARISLSSIETVIAMLVSLKMETMLYTLLCNPQIVKASKFIKKSKQICYDIQN